MVSINKQQDTTWPSAFVARDATSGGYSLEDDPESDTDPVFDRGAVRAAGASAADSIERQSKHTKVAKELVPEGEEDLVVAQKKTNDEQLGGTSRDVIIDPDDKIPQVIREADEITKAVTDDKVPVIRPPCENFMPVPEAVILQGFHWNSCRADSRDPSVQKSWYKALEEKVDEISSFGITDVWLPPPSLRY
ncbi:alpha-amylase [Cymbomonas tetramitiformis]|uniref:Alpha-amylase n=1 Tax=Cymbomonas tetramitiformis TaxID=36881 RepID=A0AAE0L815_9CHLO|nr:alpha-amylase [Cymbomonas tetramitiformis]